ncbi:unnamed protein product [Caenorhabditis sp. 36 PRJEB53466]|nr:unnamed protein product [Caenorhabditis sp. 36 PRJEB53466]
MASDDVDVALPPGQTCESLASIATELNSLNVSELNYRHMRTVALYDITEIRNPYVVRARSLAFIQWNFEEPIKSNILTLLGMTEKFRKLVPYVEEFMKETTSRVMMCETLEPSTNKTPPHVYKGETDGSALGTLLDLMIMRYHLASIGLLVCLAPLLDAQALEQLNPGRYYAKAAPVLTPDLLRPCLTPPCPVIPVAAPVAPVAPVQPEALPTPPPEIEQQPQNYQEQPVYPGGQTPQGYPAQSPYPQQAPQTPQAPQAPQAPQGYPQLAQPQYPPQYPPSQGYPQQQAPQNPTQYGPPQQTQPLPQDSSQYGQPQQYPSQQYPPQQAQQYPPQLQQQQQPYPYPAQQGYPQQAPQDPSQQQQAPPSQYPSPYAQQQQQQQQPAGPAPQQQQYPSQPAQQYPQHAQAPSPYAQTAPAPVQQQQPLPQGPPQPQQQPPPAYNQPEALRQEIEQIQEGPMAIRANRPQFGDEALAVFSKAVYTSSGVPAPRAGEYLQPARAPNADPAAAAKDPFTYANYFIGSNKSKE